MAENIVTKNDAFFAELLSPTAAKWAAGVAFDRSNGLPLDQWSVFQTEAKATEYLTSAKAYPGQVIAYAEANGDMKVCVLSQNGEGTALTLKPVGIIPSGDNKTIEVSATGEITLKGAAAATAGQQPRIVNKGTAEAPKLELEWYTPDNSTVAGLQETVGALKETVDGVVAEDGSVTKEGLTHKVATLEEKVGDKTANTGLYKEVADALAEAKSYADGKEHKNTTYELSQEGMVLTLTPSEGEADVVTIDAYNKKEIDDKFAALPEDKDTTYTAKADDKVLKLTGTEFSTELGLKHENGKISLTGIDGAVIAEFSDADFIADGVLQDVSYNAETKELTFTWNIITGTDAEGNITYKTDVVNISDLIDTYTAGDGLALSENAVFSVKIDSASETFLSVGANGVKLSGVQDTITNAVSAAEGRAATDAQNKADAAQQAAEAKAAELATAAKNEAIEDAKKYEAKADASAVYTKEEANALLNNKANADKVYSKTDADAKFRTETQVDGQIDAKITALDLDATYEPIGAEDKANKYTDDAVKPINEKLSTIAEGAQVNVLESVVKDSEATLITVSDIANKTVTIGDAPLRNRLSEMQTAITTVTETANGAKSGVEANKLLIQANTDQINALLEVDAGYSERIANLEAHDETHTGEFNSLSGRVSTAETAITDLTTGKASQTDFNALQARVGDNETAIAGLGNTKADKSAFEAHVAIAATKEELAAEADRADKAEKANANAISTLSGTVSSEIARVEGLISAEADRADEAEKANATAIENITKAETGAIAVAVAGEKARAEAAEKANADEIARVDNALKAAIENDGEGLDSIKELATWIEEHGPEASNMAKAIEANAEAIADIYTPASGEGEEAVPASGVLVSEIARVEAKIAADDATTLASAKDYSDTNLATAKSYADGKVKELSDSIHGVDDKTIKLNDDNNVYVAEVSTDILAQGSQTLVFCAGTASTVI